MLVKYESEESFNKIFNASLDFYNMSKKDQEKLKIDVIRLINLRGLVLSQRSEFKKKE